MMNCPHCQCESLSGEQLICHVCGKAYYKKPSSPEELAKFRARMSGTNALKNNDPKKKQPAHHRSTEFEQWRKKAMNTMGVVVLGFLLMFIDLNYCSVPIAPTEDQKISNYIAEHQIRISSRLKDPDSAQFKDVFASKSSGSPVVCGYVNAKNSFGGYSGYQRFISAGSIQVVESDMAEGEIDKTWQRLCANRVQY